MDDERGDFLGPPHGTTPESTLAKLNSHVVGPVTMSVCHKPD